MTVPNKPKGILFFLLSGFYLCLFAVHSMGFVAPWIPVSWSPLVHVLSPAVAFLFWVHLVFGIYFFRKKGWRMGLLALIGLISGGWVLYQDLGLGRSPLEVPAPEVPRLRVASYNVGTFQYDAANIDKVADLLNQEKPDVICLQEFRNHALPDGSYALDHLAGAFGLSHYRFVHLPVHIHGAAIYSRYPIKGIDTLYMPPKEINSGILATIETPMGKFGVANVHLSSFQVLKTWAEAKGLQAKFMALYRQARSTLILQQQKIDAILAGTEAYAYPLVLTGDMNAVPHSRASFRLREAFSDSFVAGNNGLGWTFPLARIMGLRIDYQYHSSQLGVTRFEILRSHISDHYPVVTDYMLDP